MYQKKRWVNSLRGGGDFITMAQKLRCSEEKKSDKHDYIKEKHFINETDFRVKDTNRLNKIHLTNSNQQKA